jgi:hypothetical protein
MRILQDMQIASRLSHLTADFANAILSIRESAKTAGKVAEAILVSNRLSSNESRAAVSRSRKLLDAARASSTATPGVARLRFGAYLRHEPSPGS